MCLATQYFAEKQVSTSLPSVRVFPVSQQPDDLSVPGLAEPRKTLLPLLPRWFEEAGLVFPKGMIPFRTEGLAQWSNHGGRRTGRGVLLSDLRWS